MTTAPTWSPIDDNTADTLALVALGSSTGTADREWDDYLEALRTEAMAGAGVISPNALRRRTRGLIDPKRAGAFKVRALSRGLIAYTGEWEVSDDYEGKNSGRPSRVAQATRALFASP